MAIGEATHLVTGEAMVETGLQGKMNVSSVDDLDIGPVIALLLVVSEVVLEVNFHHVPGMEELVAVGTSLEEVMIDTWMVDMMVGIIIMGTGTIMTAEIANMGDLISMLMTGMELLMMDICSTQIHNAKHFN